MSVKRLHDTTFVSYNHIRNNPKQFSALNPTIFDDIKKNHLNLITELTRTSNNRFEAFIKMLADFQINIFASNILGKDPQFDIKIEWGKITQKFQDVSSQVNIGIPLREAWKTYSLNVTKLVVKQSGFHSQT